MTGALVPSGPRPVRYPCTTVLLLDNHGIPTPSTRAWNTPHCPQAYQCHVISEDQGRSAQRGSGFPDSSGWHARRLSACFTLPPPRQAVVGQVDSEAEAGWQKPSSWPLNPF
eukprot:1968695-Rhodomonas_salina.1